MFVASCCICVGKCHHVGDCSYCIAHGGGIGFNDPITSPPPLQLPPLPVPQAPISFSTNIDLQTLNLLTELLKEVKEINEKLRRIENDMDTIRPYQ